MSLSERLALAVLVTYIPMKVLLIHTIDVSLSKTIDECVQS